MTPTSAEEAVRDSARRIRQASQDNMTVKIYCGIDEVPCVTLVELEPVGGYTITDRGLYAVHDGTLVHESRYDRLIPCIMALAEGVRAILG